MAVNWEASRGKAREILEKHGLSTPPVDIFGIAESENISIVLFKPDDETRDVSGLLDKEHKTIYVNSEEPAERQSFTVAHELAHYFLDHQPDEYGVLRRNSLHVDKPDAEKEADAFAAELLMPEKMVRDVRAKYGLTSTYDVVPLAKIFGVSISAMTYRLMGLKKS